MRNEPITGCELKNPKSEIRNPQSRGVSLIAAVFILVILGFMGVMFLSMISTSALTSVNDMQSTQALYVAEGGAEYATTQFENGTICGNLSYNNIALGLGAFTTSGQRFGPVSSNITSAITNVDTVIPVASIAGFAPQGRIRVENEEIVYAATSIVAANCAPYGQPCFTGAQRGVAGTTGSAHALTDTYGVSVPALQDMCRINSAGTVASAKRSVVVDVAGYASAAVSSLLDGTATAVGVAETKIGSLKTVLSAGNNLIIVTVAFRNTGAARNIAAGNLRLKRGAAVLASNQSLIRLGGGAVPGAGVFPQETQFLLYRDMGAGPCPTYDVTALATGAGISAEVKIVVFSNVPNFNFSDGANVRLNNNAGNDTILLTIAPGLPAGDNIIIAAVQLDDDAGQARNVAAGNLRLRRGNTNAGPILVSNQYTINLESGGNVNRGTGILLIARDAAVAANTSYTVTGSASANNAIWGEVKMLVLNGLQSNFVNGADVTPIATAPLVTTIGNLPTTLPVGDNLIIAGTQYWNTSGVSQRNILAGNERLVYNAMAQATSEYDLNLAVAANADDFASGLIWHHTGAPANPSYSIQAAASGTSVRGQTKMVAIHLNINTIPLFGWRELFP